MKKLIAILALAIPLVFCGCKDNYRACLEAASDIGTGIGQGMKTVNTLAEQGTISATEEANVLGYFEYANNATEAFQACVDAAHAAGSKVGSFTACASTFNTTLNTPSELALIKVADAQASTNISLIVNTAITAVTSLSAALGGA